jgi:hypothetical protein
MAFEATQVDDFCLAVVAFEVGYRMWYLDVNIFAIAQNYLDQAPPLVSCC